MLNDFISLLYPRVCISCGHLLYKHEEHICSYCHINLPKSHFHKTEENALAKLFYGRVPVVSVSAHYLFHKQSGIQKILHQIKYKNNAELAIQVGRWHGQDLMEMDLYQSVDVILPVPLHEKKLRQRGYNQSEKFAQGISESMKKEMDTTSLIRGKYTNTQTKKSKQERWENVEDVFELKSMEGLKNKHVLLVDDVITTGATLEACCRSLMKIENIKISIASIAFADI